jgi:CheY-like chemotaxis protein
MEMTFAGEDAQIVTVDNGEAAVSKAHEFAPDVVFADASMSGVDGYEVARRIKANGALAKTAVILMASQHNPYDDGKGRGAGVDDHVSKPFDTQSVIDRVAQVLARPRNVPAGASAAAPAAAAPAKPAAPPPAPVANANAQSTAGRTPLAGRTMMGVQPPIQPPPAPARPPVPSAPVPSAPAAAVARPAAAMAPAASASPSFVPASPPAPAVRPPPAPAPAPVSTARPAPAPTAAATNGMAAKLDGLGLSREQIEGVLALTREVVEQVVWEVVPDLAEQLIKEELKRLTAD